MRRPRPSPKPPLCRRARRGMNQGATRAAPKDSPSTRGGPPRRQQRGRRAGAEGRRMAEARAGGARRTSSRTLSAEPRGRRCLRPTWCPAQLGRAGERTGRRVGRRGAEGAQRSHAHGGWRGRPRPGAPGAPRPFRAGPARSRHVARPFAEKPARERPCAPAAGARAGVGTGARGRGARDRQGLEAQRGSRLSPLVAAWPWTSERTALRGARDEDEAAPAFPDGGGGGAGGGDGNGSALPGGRPATMPCGRRPTAPSR